MFPDNRGDTGLVEVVGAVRRWANGTFGIGGLQCNSECNGREDDSTSGQPRDGCMARRASVRAAIEYP